MAGVPDLAKREAAFKLYAQLKNISRVSKELKIPPQTLHVWKKKEDWDGKLASLKDKLRAQLDTLKKAEEDFIVEKDVNKVKILEVLEAEVAKAITEQKVQITRWDDLIKTLEFCAKERRLLMGEPTERQDGAIEVSFMREEDLDKSIKELNRFLGNKEEETPVASD